MPKKTRKCWRTYWKHIIDPLLDLELDDLNRKNAHHILLCDGVGEHLNLLRQEEDFHDFAQKRRVLLKLAANATSRTQVCDLLQFFKVIKNPDRALKDVCEQDFDRWCQILEAACQPLKEALTAAYFEEFMQVLALNFFVTFPAIKATEIKKQWNKIGFFDSLERCVMNCTKLPDSEEFEQIKENMPKMIKEMIRVGKCTDVFIVGLGLRAPVVVHDGKALKSQLCVILSHDAQRTDALQRLQEVEQKIGDQKRRKTQADEKKRMAGNRREVDSKAAGRRQPVKAAAKALLRTESEKVVDDPNDPLDDQCFCDIPDDKRNADGSTERKQCPIRWSVLTKHPEYKTAMFTCEHCKKSACSLCVHDQEAFVAMHELNCKILSLGRQYYALQQQQLGDNEDEDNECHDDEREDEEDGEEEE